MNCPTCNKKLYSNKSKTCRSHKGDTLPFCSDCGVKLKDYRSKKCKVCANLGGNNPAYGKKRSIEARRKTSSANKGNPKCAWNKGKTLSKEHRQAIRLGQLKRVAEGKHNFWKGGLWSKPNKSRPDRLERLKFRQSIQKKVFERDDYTCQLCGKRGVALQVDHIQSWKDYIELRFEIGNCRTLCMKCHYKITFGKPMPPRTKNWGHHLNHVIKEGGGIL